MFIFFAVDDDEMLLTRKMLLSWCVADHMEDSWILQQMNWY